MGGTDSNWAQAFDLNKVDWYYGAIDRTEAERVLKGCAEDSFLVRKSSIPGSFALSMWEVKPKQLTHTLIEPRQGGFGFQDNPKVYSSLVDMITTSPETKGLKTPMKGVRLE